MEPAAPLVVAFVGDLYFSTRIESAADMLGFRVRLVETASDVTGGAEGSARQVGEPLAGGTAALVEQITRLQPALLVFDLGNTAVPWREWLSVLKSVSATRRIPAIAFGAHMQVEVLQAAKEAGADVVLARSAFTQDIPGLLRKYARIPDWEGLASACAEPLSAVALHGLELFNKGEYFEAHEVLEAAWNADPTPGRELYRAILQVAVAYLQIERGNYRGAVKMFLRLRQWLDPLPGRCRGVDVDRLRADAAAVEAALLAGGPSGIAAFDWRVFHPVVYL